MKKQMFMRAAIVLSLVLAACGSADAPPTQEATDTPTEVVASPTASSPATDTPAADSEEASEAVESPEPVTEPAAAAFPTPNPNPECVLEPIPEDPNIPPVTADEWSKGPDDALVTLIEYGDFQ